MHRMNGNESVLVDVLLVAIGYRDVDNDNFSMVNYV